MKQLKIIFKSGADITLWVEDYAWAKNGPQVAFPIVPAEGQPSVPYVNTGEIAAVVQLS